MSVQGIILAAGLSSRFPDYKLVQKISNKQVLQMTIESMIDFVDTIFIVTGHNKSLIEEISSSYDKVRCIHNPDYHKGMYSSVRIGVSKVTADRFFIIPADCPSVQSETYRQLLDSVGKVVIPSFNYKSGHPILLSSSLIEAMIQGKHEHLRAFLSDYQKKYVVVSDPGVLEDMDTPEQYEMIKRRLGHENH